METVVGVILQKLADQIVKDVNNHAQYAIDFGIELQEMKEKLKFVNGFFVDMDNLNERKEVLKEALIQLRDWAYDADDVLTDCIIRDEYKKGGSCTCFSPNDLIFAYEMGKKLKDLNSRMGKIEKSISSYLIPQQHANMEENKKRAAGKGYFCAQHFDLSGTIGLENGVQMLKEWIIEEKVHKIGVVGMGGLGKTTLARKIYDDEDVAASFNQRIWVTVSQDFNEKSIIKSILNQLEKDDSEQDISQMLSKIKQLIEYQNCLIVMDDFWTPNSIWWQDLCSSILQLAGKNTCIIITTRFEQVATDMGVNRSQIYKPKVLNEKDSWSLFCKIALCPEKNIFDDPHIKDVAEKIVGKCGGLPLAIKTIAALSASKLQLNDWKKVYRDFQQLTIGDGSPVTASLKLSYDALPSHLKQFFLCFSIYPEDFEVQAAQLVGWWIGEGLIQGEDLVTAAEMASEYLAELCGRCLVDAVKSRGYDGKVYSCKMHDLVRDLSIKIAGDERFCSFEGGKQKLSPTSRWLGFTRDENSKISLSLCSKLRALILMSRIPAESLTWHENMGSLVSLRVLDLTDAMLDKESVANLWKWIISLKRLAHLNLSGVSGLTQVPSSIRKLRNLQVLILGACRDLVELHSYIAYLRRLVVLDLELCDDLLYLPKGIGMLNQLQVLTGFKVSKSCHLLELECLVQLRVLGMNLSDESEIFNNELEVLSKLEKLKVLSIDTGGIKSSLLEKLHELKPPPSLEELYLSDYHHKDLPKWINPTNFSDLMYLCIEDGGITHIISPTEKNDSKWKLVGLSLKFLRNLEDDWEKLKDFMPSLCYAEFMSCSKLKNPPYGEDRWIWRKTAS